MKKNIIFLVGPTASGKTTAAACLAGKINAEIISCDSMQVYKGMDIMTSKAPAYLRKKLRHHMVSIIPVDKAYSVERYYKDASKAVKDILRRGKTPLITGGTGLYMTVLIDGIFKADPASKARAGKIRDELIRRAKEPGSASLHKELSVVDPEAARKIHPNDTRRIIRALEVFRSTGEPISRLQKKRRGLGDEYDIKVFGLNMPRDALYEKIDKRVGRMFSAGLVLEIKKLLKSRLSKTACYALGIREVKGYLDGLYGMQEAKRLLKKNTRNYAKRQLTWFRKDKRIKWIDIAGKDKASDAAKKILLELRGIYGEGFTGND
ncbi:MAG: tRNA (adenosine(37)-N6)-dimethylallyltransferase MiaA [Candidatus Omnitrophota bacterium]|jgi:tRNA dimethylallyltransferase